MYLLKRLGDSLGSPDYPSRATTIYHGCLSVGLGPGVPISSGIMLEMQILRSYPKTTELEPLRVKPTTCVLASPPWDSGPRNSLRTTVVDLTEDGRTKWEKHQYGGHKEYF